MAHSVYSARFMLPRYLELPAASSDRTVTCMIQGI